jgi:hypothetical protein
MYFPEIDTIPQLQDITDLNNEFGLLFEDEPFIFEDETNTLDLIETAFHLIDEFIDKHPHIVSEPNFHDILLDEIKELFYVQFEDHILNDEYDDIEDTLYELLDDAFQIYITIFHNNQIHIINNSLDNTIHDEKKRIIERIQYLKSIPQPEQRTKEWYEFRNNLITASNAYKAFETPAKINELIYEKCQPIKQVFDNEITIVNTNTSLHW